MALLPPQRVWGHMGFTALREQFRDWLKPFSVWHGALSKPGRVGETVPTEEDPVAAQPVAIAKSIEASERRALVDSFLLTCRQEVPLNVTKTHIWRAAGHATARQFQHWQAGKDRPPGTKHGATGEDDKNFRRILAMQPGDFVELLHKKGIG